METNHAQDQAKAQYECLAEMVERLEHCQTCSGEFTSADCEFYNPFENADDWEDYHDEESARIAINEDPLEISVRSGWCSPGGNGIDNQFEAEDFFILLCTGGPAVRIRGELSNGSPYRAWLEYQDWGTPWTQYFDAEQDTLLAYANQFYFGD